MSSNRHEQPVKVVRLGRGLFLWLLLISEAVRELRMNVIPAPAGIH